MNGAGPSLEARDTETIPSLPPSAPSRLAAALSLLTIGLCCVALLPRLAEQGLIAAAHDVSIGGLAVAAARMAIAGGCGADVTLCSDGEAYPTAAWFGERGGRVLVAVRPEHVVRLAASAESGAVRCERLGSIGGPSLRLDGLDIGLGELRAAYETPFPS